MHGRIKVKTTKEKEEAERKEKNEKAAKYKKGFEISCLKRKTGDKSDESLQLTAQLLSVNPDVYTLWNYRREILLERKKAAVQDFTIVTLARGDGDSQEQQADSVKHKFDKLCDDELSLTEMCLAKNPKSYSAWFQRSFVLDLMFEPDLHREIRMCADALTKDDRNFHCWDHRNLIISRLKLPLEEDLSFTTERINSNFSNFSSWFYRSRLISKGVVTGLVNIDEIWPNEYELVENAIFTDPTDQSAWFYHRWLTNTNFEDLKSSSSASINSKHVNIVKLVISDRSTSCIVLSRPVDIFPTNISIKVTSPDGGFLDVVPEKIEDFVSSIWVFQTLSTPSIVKVTRDTEEIGTITVPDHPDFILVAKFQSPQETKDSKFRLSETHLQNFSELEKMEPDNKWVNLMNFDIGTVDCALKYQTLCKVDGFRTNYYEDQMSKRALSNLEKEWSKSVAVTFTSLNLSCIPMTDQMVHVQFLDLSKNKLTRIKKSFNYLVCLKTLIVDDNMIRKIDQCVQMKSLQQLSIKRNRLSEIGDLGHLLDSAELVKVLIFGNSLKLKHGFEGANKIVVDDEIISAPSETKFYDLQL